MKSELAKAIKTKYSPVAVIFTDTRPEKARQFKEGRWGCVMFMLAAAVKGETVAFDRKTFGCFGGGTGLGFGNQYRNFPGGEDCFCYFLSVGNEQWETGRQAAQQVKPYLREEAFDDFMKGERYLKTPDLVKDFIVCLPITDIPFTYVVFKPLKDVDPEVDKPEIILFLGDMDQVSALTVMANYHRPGNENVIFPQAAGCMTLVLSPLHESKSDTPRAVLGLNDISARLYLKRLLKDDVMSFAIPYNLFVEMEKNVDGSFLRRSTWEALMRLK